MHASPGAKASRGWRLLLLGTQVPASVWWAFRCALDGAVELGGCSNTMSWIGPDSDLLISGSVMLSMLSSSRGIKRASEASEVSLRQC